MSKLIAPFDLSSYSQLVNLAGTSPTTTDMRGVAVIGAQREWGALEYDAALSINNGGAKTITAFDLSSYSQLVNLAGTSPTTTDMRGASVQGSQREWGALEYNSALSITAPIVYEQEGYRFRNDDGTEVAATWQAAQDTAISLVALTNVRVRVLVNVTNDPPATAAYRLEYRKVNSLDWRKVQ